MSDTLPNTDTQIPQSPFDKFVAGVARKFLAGVNGEEDAKPGWLSQKVNKIVVEPVLEDDGVQTEVAGIIQNEMEEGIVSMRANVPSAFDTANENMGEAVGPTLYQYIRGKVKTENETFGQKIIRPIFARLLSAGSRIFGFLSVSFANNVYSGDFDDTQKTEYRKTMREWFGYWSGRLFGKNEDQTQSPSWFSNLFKSFTTDSQTA